MPRRSVSPRRSPSRRSRSPDGARSRGGSHRDDRYGRDSKSRDDGDYGRRNRNRSREGRDRDTRDRRDDYRRDRPRDGDRRRDDRERNRYDDERRSSRREGSYGEARGERRSEREPDSRRPRSKSRSKSGSPAPEEDKAKPNFGNSGLLAAATNTVKHGDGTSTLLKYNEPPEARKPLENWRLSVFKGKEQVDLLHLHRQSAYLIGRDPKICDLPIEHPSCSKQHAVIQFRQVHVKDEFGTVKAVIKPFVIDLESTNGTMVNDAAIPVSRYYELKASDVLKFGESTREYVLLHDNAL